MQVRSLEKAEGKIYCCVLGTVLARCKSKIGYASGIVLLHIWELQSVIFSIEDLGTKELSRSASSVMFSMPFLKIAKNLWIVVVHVKPAGLQCIT